MAGAGDGYPERESHFAHKLTRLLGRTCAAQEIGHVAWCLVAHIAHTEDAARYRRPVTFWNHQLESVLGLSWGRLDRARKRAVAAGWLHYERQANRRVGKYWCLIPQEHQDLPDSPVDEDFVHTGEEITVEEIENNEASIHTSEERTVEEPGNNRGISAEPSSLRPNPDPSPTTLLVENVQPPPTNGDNDKPPKPLPKLRFGTEHSELAKYMFARIQDVMPGTPVPIYGKWAHQLRIMVERDGLPLDQIKNVFDWANADDFWKTNIKSPGKLRKQFPTLLAKMKKDHVKPNPSQHHDPNRPVEAI